MMRPRFWLHGLVAATLLLSAGLPTTAAPASDAAPVAGAAEPAGTLVIAGGGDLPPSVFQTFVAAAGGRGARIAVLPVASGVPKESLEAFSGKLAGFGVTLVPITLPDRKAAGDPAKLAELRRCTGFWFTGGDQNRIGDRVVGTPVHHLLWDKFRAGAVIGGTSAGAAAMSRIMLTGKGDLGETAPRTFPTREGLGFVSSCIVDQHFLRRQRENRLLSLIQEHPDLFAVGIDEETALVVHQGKARIVGNRRVLVFDPRSATVGPGTLWNLHLHLLGPGQNLDLTTRQPG